MLQLPHMGMDVIKKLSRKKVRGLGELLEMPAPDRLAVLEDSGAPPWAQLSLPFSREFS